MLTHALMAVLGAGLATGLLLALYNPTSGGSGISLPGSGAVPAPGNPSAPLSGGEQAIVTKVRPGLVIINTTLQYNSEAAAGTGMVINADGLVLTNNHVIDGSTKITATVASTGTTYTATVLGYDQTGDIALIRLRNASGLTTVPIGNSASVKAGTAVVALGNAEGRGTITAKPGQVSALGQTITASEGGGSMAAETLHGMIQTNADIVPGDSGGPLASSAGVIGMDTAGNEGNDQQASTGFAIPINMALSVARQIAGGHASSAVTIGYPPFVGIFTSSGPDSSPQAQAQQEQQQNGGFSGGTGSTPQCYTSNSGLIVPPAIAPVSSGTLIIGTICGSPAASAGMTGGAVITAVNAQAVGSPDDLRRILSRFHPGEVISVTWVSPSGQRTTSSLHLTAGPPQLRGSHSVPRRRSRLGIGRAEQRLVGGAEVGGGQAIRVQLPDLFGYGDGDLDVLAAAGRVEALGVRAELGLGVQRLVADREQGGGGDPVAESVRGHGRGLHVHGEGTRLTEAAFGQGEVQLPVPVRGGVDDSHPAAQAPSGQLAEQQRVQRVVRYDRNAQRQHVVEDTVVAHVGGRQHQVPGLLMVAQASTVPDHQHEVRAQHSQVIGDRLGVRRPDAYVHHGHARTPGKHVVPRGHLAAIRIRAGAIRQSGAKLLQVPGVVG